MDEMGMEKKRENKRDSDESEAPLYLLLTP